MIRTFDNVSMRIKALAASVVLLVCLAAVGAEAYFTLDRSARNLDALSSVNLPNQDIITKLKDNVTEIHVKLFRYVTWASSGVNATLLNALSSEIRAELEIIATRLRQIAARPELSAAERSSVTDLFAKWDKYDRAAIDTLN